MTEQKETREEFMERYPRPRSSVNGESTRVLASCECDYDGCTGWVWAIWYFDVEEYGFRHGLMSSETLAEDEPTPPEQ